MFAFLVWPLSRHDISSATPFHPGPRGFKLSACRKVCSKQARVATFLFGDAAQIMTLLLFIFVMSEFFCVGGPVAVNSPAALLGVRTVRF